MFVPVPADLEKNGLELESVSLTGLDQTNVDHFDENNAFDAQGLTKITKTIEENRKMQNDLRQESTVEISRRNLSAEKEQLEIRKQEEFAKLSKEEDVANKAAEQASRISLTETEQKRIAEEARIAADRDVEEANIERSRHIKESEIAKEIAISEKTKQRSIVGGEVKQTQINADRQVRESEIEKEKSIKEAQIALIQSREKAEKDAIEKTLAAQAEAEAAEKEAEAIRVLAEAQERQYDVEAEGLRKKTEAENAVSNDLIELRIKLALIEALPQIIAESVKPIESIDSLKVIDVNGLGGIADGGPGKISSGATGNGAQDLVNAALRYRAQSPLLRKNWENWYIL